VTLLPHDPRERAERREAIKVLWCAWGGMGAGVVGAWVLRMWGVW